MCIFQASLFYLQYRFRENWWIISPSLELETKESNLWILIKLLKNLKILENLSRSGKKKKRPRILLEPISFLKNLDSEKKRVNREKKGTLALI